MMQYKDAMQYKVTVPSQGVYWNGYQTNSKIAAIKVYKTITKRGLADSKRDIEAMPDMFNFTCEGSFTDEDRNYFRFPSEIIIEEIPDKPLYTFTIQELANKTFQLNLKSGNFNLDGNVSKDDLPFHIDLMLKLMQGPTKDLTSTESCDIKTP